MAALILQDNVLALEFEALKPSPAQGSIQLAFVALDDGGQSKQMTVPAKAFIQRERSAFSLPNPENLLAQLLPYSNRLKASVTVDGIVTHSEDVKLDRSVVCAMFDALSVNVKRFPLEQRPGDVAVFTHAYNEGEMLLFWERHFSRMVGFENCFVINNGGADDSLDKLNPRTNRLKLPLSPIDHWEWCQFNGYFQRFLLRRYKWVVHVDTDEMIVCDGDLKERLLRSPAGVYAPEKSVAVVHDVDKEGPFDFSRSLLEQRTTFISEDNIGFKKPCIGSVPATWTPGFHQCFEGWKELPGVWLVHMREVDASSIIRRNLRFGTRVQSARDSQIYAGVKSWKDKSEEEIRVQVPKDLRARCSEPKVSLPNWIRSAI